VLDSLRQPIENGNVSIARANAHVTYPAEFQLIAAMNPCKCGYFDTPAMKCSKAPKCAEDYQNKLSGPLLDRFDIKIEVVSNFLNEDKSAIEESSAVVKQRVEQARKLQHKRYKKYASKLNAKVESSVLLEST